MAGGISSSVLLGWYQSFYGGKGTGTSSTSVSSGTGTTTAPTTQYAPTAPWSSNLTQPSQSSLVKAAIGGANLFNASAAQLDLPNATDSADYKKLFALYSGLNTLYSIATEANGKNVSSLQLSQLQTAFNNGMAQLQKYLGATSFSKLKLTGGVTQESQTSSITTPAQESAYDTNPLNTTGDSSAVAPAFQGNVAFNVTVQVGSSTPKVIAMNLNDMGSTPRTMANVLAYLNGQMKAGGAIASFATDPNPAAPNTIQVGNKTVTVSSGTETWGLQLNTNPIENVTLSAPTSGAAVYLGQTVGNIASSIGPSGNTVAPDAQNQLLKFNASGDGVLAATTPAHAASDQLTTTDLGPSVNSVQATAVAPDGSVYVLANVNATTDGGTPAGGQDVALMKYDSAGHVLFSTDLGSAASASGLSLAVSPDGTQVAIAGQVTGSMTADQVVNDPTGANSFVAVYDSSGDQVWNQQDDGITPNQANAVAFGADGTVYVTGSSQATTGVQSAQGPSSSYLQAFDKTGAQISNTKIATTGSNTSTGIAVDGNNVYVAGTENGDAVITEYDVTSPKAPAVVATRDLGSLQGGNVVGLAVQNGTVYIAGSTHNAALSAGTVTAAAPGSGLNTFAATLSTGLAPAGTDQIAYYGGDGDTRATGMTVANGDVWITGTATGSLPGEPAIGAQDGFVASLNVGTGAVDYAQRFTGLDGNVAPTSIAVAPTGESILDQIGLPQGVVNGPVSTLLTSTTGLKVGDSFKIATGGGSPVTITIQATDTMASLATEISQKTGFTVNASTSPGVNGSTALEIKPVNPGQTVSLINGPTGTDALSELGLKPGVVADTASQNGVTVMQGSTTPIYGLGLPASLDLTSAANIKTAQVQLAGAVSVVEQAYQNLANSQTPANVLALQKAQASGKVPAYLSAQIANYQAAITRLTAGQTGTTSLSSLL
ncbi:MAG TPA: hypothetical protein VHW60_11330 [Caulobacteraceae bacterium]|nr:hypothetical protein [Caulobacteraceae bacterium]